VRRSLLWRPREDHCGVQRSNIWRELLACRHNLSRELAEKCANFFAEFTEISF
jgi:hypothetical protein